jgi:glycerol-3-phosphate dehydrogenase
LNRPWTATASLPGGDFSYADVEQRITDLSRKYSFMTPRNVRRIFRAYGTDAEAIFDGARFAQDMGRSFGLLTEREVDWLVSKEWARGADDILWRRSKLGLHLTQQEQDDLREHFAPQKKAKSRKRAEG